MDALLHNPALRLFGITYLILVVKMVAVGWSTSFYRIRDKTFATPEDYRLQGLTPKTGVHEDVERTRRAHRNDLENILPYFGVGLLYALTNPSLTAARIYFIGYTVARVLHSVFYLMEMQPHRTIAFGVAQVLMLVMLASTLITLL
jgi:glutathione S-transferase